MMIKNVYILFTYILYIHIYRVCDISATHTQYLKKYVETYIHDGKEYMYTLYTYILCIHIYRVRDISSSHTQ